MNPKVSIIMPVYNKGPYLKEAIESSLNQSFSDFELVIIDDGSTDNSAEIIKNFKDSRITFLKLNHGGVVNALNEGIKVAKGEYIIRDDADDVSLIGRYEKLVNFMEQNPEIVLCGSYCFVINEKGERIGKRDHVPITDLKMKLFSFYRNPTTAVIFRKKDFEKIGGYKKYKRIEDYEIYTRFFEIGKVANIPEFLYEWRRYNDQVSTRHHFYIRFIGIYIRFLAFVRVLKYLLKNV